MPKASKKTASDSMTLEGYEGHFEELGGYTLSASRRTPPTPTWRRLFAGLPDDPLPMPPLRLRTQGGKVKFHLCRRHLERYETGEA